MNQNDDSNDIDIDEIEITDLHSDEEPQQKQDNIVRHLPGQHFKRRVRQGMAATIFVGCIALCLILWPDIAALFPAGLFQRASTPTSIATNPSRFMAEEPLTTNVFVFGATAYISTFNYTQSSHASPGRLDAIHISNGESFWHDADPIIASPVMANNILFIPSIDGIYALRASDRVILWHTNTPATIYRVDNGLIYTQPNQISGQVVITGGGSPTFSTQASENNNTLEALRVRDGSVVWQHTIDLFTNYVGESSGTVYLSTYEANANTSNTGANDLGSRLDAIRISDGSIFWSKENANVVNVSSEGDNLVCLTYSPTSGNTQNPSSIDVLSRKDGKGIWHRDNIQSIESVEQGIVYTIFQTGNVFNAAALQLNNGSLIWQKNAPTEPSLASIGNIAYLFASQDDVNNITALNAKNGAVLWQKNTPNATGALVGNVIYSINNQSLDAWQVNNGSHLWQNRDVLIYQPDLFGSVAANGILYVISNNGWVISAIQISDGKTLWDYEEPLLG
jgi:PQQ-like domain